MRCPNLNAKDICDDECLVVVCGAECDSFVRSTVDQEAQHSKRRGNDRTNAMLARELLEVEHAVGVVVLRLWSARQSVLRKDIVALGRTGASNPKTFD